MGELGVHFDGSFSLICIYSQTATLIKKKNPPFVHYISMALLLNPATMCLWCLFLDCMVLTEPAAVDKSLWSEVV